LLQQGHAHGLPGPAPCAWSKARPPCTAAYAGGRGTQPGRRSPKPGLGPASPAIGPAWSHAGWARAAAYTWLWPGLWSHVAGQWRPAFSHKQVQSYAAVACGSRRWIRDQRVGRGPACRARAGVGGSRLGRWAWQTVQRRRRICSHAHAHSLPLTRPLRPVQAASQALKRSYARS
jgi:hypothetical protein